MYNLVVGTTTWYDYPDPPCLRMLKEDLTVAAEAIEAGTCQMQDYDEELVDRFHPVIKGIAIGYILFGVVLNILIYKCRSLVDWLFLYEMIFFSIFMSVPSSKNTYSVYNSLIYNCV